MKLFTHVAVLFFPVIFPAQAAKISTVKVVPYFAGKDELCLDKKTTQYQLRLSKVIREINVFSSSDREESCTFVGTDNAQKKKVERLFSASGSRCSEWTASPAQIVAVSVAGDHICKIEKVNEN